MIAEERKERILLKLAEFAPNQQGRQFSGSSEQAIRDANPGRYYLDKGLTGIGRAYDAFNNAVGAVVAPPINALGEAAYGKDEWQGLQRFQAAENRRNRVADARDPWTLGAMGRRALAGANAALTVIPAAEAATAGVSAARAGMAGAAEAVANTIGRGGGGFGPTPALATVGGGARGGAAAMAGGPAAAIPQLPNPGLVLAGSTMQPQKGSNVMLKDRTTRELESRIDAAGGPGAVSADPSKVPMIGQLQEAAAQGKIAPMSDRQIRFLGRGEEGRASVTLAEKPGEGLDVRKTPFIRDYDPKTGTRLMPRRSRPGQMGPQEDVTRLVDAENRLVNAERRGAELVQRAQKADPRINELVELPQFRGTTPSTATRVGASRQSLLDVGQGGLRSAFEGALQGARNQYQGLESGIRAVGDRVSPVLEYMRRAAQQGVLDIDRHQGNVFYSTSSGAPRARPAVIDVGRVSDLRADPGLIASLQRPQVPQFPLTPPAATPTDPRMLFMRDIAQQARNVGSTGGYGDLVSRLADILGARNIQAPVNRVVVTPGRSAQSIGSTTADVGRATANADTVNAATVGR